MSYNSLLIHRCTVRRYTETGTDSHGQPVVTWDDLATGVRCRLNWHDQTERFSIPVASVRRYKLFVPRAQDVRHEDRIYNITYSNGTVFEPGPFNVAEVKDFSDRHNRHHLELSLERVGEAGT